jgi:hypothetical protein
MKSILNIDEIRITTQRTRDYFCASFEEKYPEIVWLLLGKICYDASKGMDHTTIEINLSMHSLLMYSIKSYLCYKGFQAKITHHNGNNVTYDINW